MELLASRSMIRQKKNGFLKSILKKDLVTLLRINTFQNVGPIQFRSFFSLHRFYLTTVISRHAMSQSSRLASLNKWLSQRKVFRASEMLGRLTEKGGCVDHLKSVRIHVIFQNSVYTCDSIFLLQSCFVSRWGCRCFHMKRYYQLTMQ